MKEAAHDLRHLFLQQTASSPESSGERRAGELTRPLSGDPALLVRTEGRKVSGDVGGQQQEGGLRHRRQRVHRLRARQDAVGEGVCREDDGQEPRFGSLIPLFFISVFSCFSSLFFLVSRNEGEIF